MNNDINSPKNWTTCLILLLVLGCFAAHRFYVGKFFTAILFFLTIGGLGIWWIIDAVYIVQEKFKDSKGLEIKK